MKQLLLMHAELFGRKKDRNSTTKRLLDAVNSIKQREGNCLFVLACTELSLYLRPLKDKYLVVVNPNFKENYGAQLLQYRGIEKVEEYINPPKSYHIDPEKLDNIKRGIDLLRETLRTDKRILLTPGIVELEKYKDQVYEELAVDIAASCDIVILVGYEETRKMYEKLKRYNQLVYYQSGRLQYQFF